MLSSKGPRRPPFSSPVSFLLGTYIARTAFLHGFHVVEATAETAALADSGDMTRLLSNIQVDGVIFHGPESAAQVQAFLDLEIPVVQLMRPQDEARTSTITVDPEPGIAAGVDHLMCLGHRRIAFIGTTSSHPNDAIREKIFLDTLRDRGIATRESDVHARDQYSVEEGAAATRALMSAAEPPTAIFAAGDSLALGVLHACHALRLRIPDDVTLMSYDDAFVGSFYPPLTSVSQPYEQIAEHAVSLIAQAVSDPGSIDADAIHIVYPSQLVVRASSVPPRERR
jgi:LacI family transcriptional regulator